MKPKKKGPIPLEERMPKEKIIKAYQMHGTIRQAADALGVSHPTLMNALKRLGIATKNRSEAMKVAHRNVSHFSEFAKWLKDNQGKLMPRDISKLQELSGCSKDTICCYFYRRRKALKELLATVPDLRKIDALLQDDLGNSYKTKEIDSYEYLIDKFSLKVKILAFLHDKRRVLLPIEDPKKFTNLVNTIFSEAETSHLHQSQELLSQPEKLANNPLVQGTQKLSGSSETEETPAASQDTEEQHHPS